MASIFNDIIKGLKKSTVNEIKGPKHLSITNFSILFSVSIYITVFYFFDLLVETIWAKLGQFCSRHFLAKMCLIDI